MKKFVNEINVQLSLNSQQYYKTYQLPNLQKTAECGTKFRSLNLDDLERLREDNVGQFKSLSFEVKRGPNRGRIYHKYREELIQNFEPLPKVFNY